MRQFLTSSAIISAIVLSLGVPVWAQSAAPDQFKLSAQKSELPQLSRSEIDPSAMPQFKAPASPSSAISYANVATPYAAPDNASLKARALQTDEDDPQAYLKETNVDWSKWIGALADRWHFVLRQYEDGANLEFVTQRAALVQFTVYDNGQIGRVVLQQSSGNAIYDRLQVLALMQAVPMPPFPAGTQRSSITLLQGWESHIRKPGESKYTPGNYGANFPMEKVREWVMGRQ